MATELIREKLMRQWDELPYQVAVEIESFNHQAIDSY